MQAWGASASASCSRGIDDTYTYLCGATSCDRLRPAGPIQKVIESDWRRRWLALQLLRLNVGILYWYVTHYRWSLWSVDFRLSMNYGCPLTMHLIKHTHTQTHSHFELIADEEFLFYALSQKELKKNKKSKLNLTASRAKLTMPCTHNWQAEADKIAREMVSKRVTIKKKNWKIDEKWNKDKNKFVNAPQNIKKKIWHTNWNVKCRWVTVCECGGANLFSNWVKMQLTLPPGGNLWQLWQQQSNSATGVVHLATTWFICNAYETDLVSCLAAHHTRSSPILQYFQFPIEDRKTAEDWRSLVLSIY